MNKFVRIQSILPKVKTIFLGIIFYFIYSWTPLFKGFRISKACFYSTNDREDSNPSTFQNKSNRRVLRKHSLVFLVLLVRHPVFNYSSSSEISVFSLLIQWTYFNWLIFFANKSLILASLMGIKHILWK